MINKILDELRDSNQMSSEVIAFCDGCNIKKDRGICMLGPKNQLKFFSEGICDWAAVKKPDGEIVRGTMTMEGFVPVQRFFPSKERL